MSPVLAIIDRMMATPAANKAAPVEPSRNPHAGAAAAITPAEEKRPSAPSGAPRDALDEAAELFKVIFKGDIVP